MTDPQAHDESIAMCTICQRPFIVGESYTKDFLHVPCATALAKAEAILGDRLGGPGSCGERAQLVELITTALAEQAAEIERLTDEMMRETRHHAEVRGDWYEQEATLTAQLAACREALEQIIKEEEKPHLEAARLGLGKSSPDSQQFRIATAVLATLPPVAGPREP